MDIPSRQSGGLPPGNIPVEHQTQREGRDAPNLAAPQNMDGALAIAGYLGRVEVGHGRMISDIPEQPRHKP